jgi:CheY-like chemotaxis protein
MAMRAGVAGIIVCDDDAIFRGILRSRLVGMGQTVFVAAGGMEAVAVAAQIDPIVVLLDLMMPGMNGLEACRLLRLMPNTAQTPIVMLTGVCAADSEAAALRAGATVYLNKPIAVTELLRILTRFLPGRPGAPAAGAVPRSDLDMGRKILTVLRH